VEGGGGGFGFGFGSEKGGCLIFYYCYCCKPPPRVGEMVKQMGIWLPAGKKLIIGLICSASDMARV